MRNRVLSRTAIIAATLALLVSSFAASVARGATVDSMTVPAPAGASNAIWFFDDTTPPVIAGLPADIVVVSDPSGGAVVTWTQPTATDDVDGVVPVVCTHDSGGYFFVGTTTVACDASDAAGNWASGSFNIEITEVDLTPPALYGVPIDIWMDTSDPAGAIVGWQPAPFAIDDVDGSLPVSCSPASGSHFAVGTTSVVCSAADAAGNLAEADPFTVHLILVDSDAPVLSGMPANFEDDTTDQAGRTVSWPTPSAVDAIDGTVTVACFPTSGSTFSVGTTTVTCTASDAAGNVASDSFTVTINFVDSTPPAMSGVPAGITAATTDASGRSVTWTLPNASDAVDGPVPVSCNPVSGSHFAVGSTRVTCTASDAAGNVASDSFTVQITLTIVDATAPVISGVPSGIDAATTDPAGRTVSWSAPTAVDATDGTVPVSCAPASGSRFRVGPTSVTCSAADAAGNVATRSFTVRLTLTDTTPPTLTGVPRDITVQTSPSARMAVTWTQPTAVDDVDGPVPVTCNPASGSAFPVGSTTVKCTASDSAGNVAAGSFSVVVMAATPDPEPGPATELSVAWRKPIGESAQYSVRIGKKLDLKAKLAVNGVALRKKAGTPRLVVERLTACGGTVVDRRDGGKLKSDDGTWKVELKTSKLGVGCWRISVALGAAEGGAFELTVRAKDVARGDVDRRGDDDDDDDDDEGDDDDDD